MTALSIRNLPDSVHRALRLRAAKHGRSTDAEIRLILEMAVNAPERVKLGSLMRAIAEKVGALLTMRRSTSINCATKQRQSR